ncbi:MAG: phosphatase PAP2 family protein [Phycisphaerae bacterium]
MRGNLRIALVLVPLAAGCAGPAPHDEPLARRLATLADRRLSAAEAARARDSAAPRAHASPPGAAPADARVALLDFASDGAAPADPSAAGNVDGESAYLRRPLLPGFGETVKRDAKEVGHDLWRDTKRVYGNPVNLAILGTAYGGALALQETGPDGTVERHYDRHSSFSHDWNEAFAATGNPAVHFALAGTMYLVGQQTQNDKTYEVGRALFSALIINDLTAIAGQAATSDKAPNGEWGTFPSGHTSSSFAVATVLNEAYGPFVGVPMYGVATLVGVSRLDDREHYLSDVAFGAVMGTVIGHAVASGRDPEIFGWKVLPYADPASGAAGVAIGKSMK